MKLRRISYNYGIFSQMAFRVPIISVGNITFGGTGKTPFTIWLSQYLEAQNKNVMILTRGYKGELENTAGVLKSEKFLGYNPSKYGDEALLLARKLKKARVVVGKNRGKNLLHYFDLEGTSKAPDIVVLDDGHQHLKVKRRTNIVLFDASMPLSRYKVVPRGYLREGFSALNVADAIVITRADQVERKKIDSLIKMIEAHTSEQLPICEVSYKPIGLYNQEYEKLYDLSYLEGKDVVCIAGIASPGSFYDLVSSLGAKIKKRFTFPDHHYFSQQELDEVLNFAEENNCLVVTTEKDMVKMRRAIGKSDLICYLEVQIHFLKGEQELLNVVSGQLD